MNLRYKFEFPSGLLAMSFDLRSIGVAELAWKFPEVLDVIQFITDKGYPIFGGDVYRIDKGVIVPALDNWYVKTEINPYAREYIKESRLQSSEFITFYHARNGDDFLYSLVV